MIYNIVFHPEAKKELDRFDNSIKLLILKQIKKISENPEIGELLGNKAGIDLHFFRKIYAVKKKMRIVYKIVNNELIVYIISIGKRDKLYAYESALERK